MTDAINATDESGRFRVVIFGDSITEGLDLPLDDRTGVWVRVVEEQSAGRLQMINEGKGGRPTDSLEEFRAVLERYQRVDLLVLALGGNDARDISAECVPRALNNLGTMVALARQTYGDDLPVLLVAPTNIRKDALGPTRPIANERESKLRELGAAYMDLAPEWNCEFVSLYGIIPYESLVLDGVHPDRAGHAALAETMLRKLLTFLPKAS